MKKVFIIHGFEGSPNGGWRPWLMAELEKKDIYACALSMPRPEMPKKSEWIEEIKRHVDINNKDEIYLIGHSLGVPAILRYLEEYSPSNISGVILVSGPVNSTNEEKIDDFMRDSFNFEVIKSKIKKTTVIHGDNDPLVPLSDAETISKKLDCKLMVVNNGKHLNGSAGFNELPKCLEALNEMML